MRTIKVHVSGIALELSWMSAGMLRDQLDRELRFYEPWLSEALAPKTKKANRGLTPPWPPRHPDGSELPRCPTQGHQMYPADCPICREATFGQDVSAPVSPRDPLP
jgi:hypothetical protein